MLEVILNIDSPDGPRQVPLNGESLTIGRSAFSTVVITDDSGLSRTHATIHRAGNEIRIVDNQSINGTYVNCGLVPPGGSLISDGDEIFLGNHTVMTVTIIPARKKGRETKGPLTHSSLPLWLFAVPVAVVLAGLTITFVLRKFSGSFANETETGQVSTQAGQQDKAYYETQKQETDLPNAGSDTDTNVTPLSIETSEIPGRLKLYKSMTVEEKREFIKERAEHVAIMMGKRPYAFTPDALDYIKFWLEAFAARVGNKRTGLWRGDTRFILERGKTHAPLIIRAFKGNRVPPVLGLYIPFIETEYTNIASNNAAGAAGLFQFLGPTAEHYGVSSSERTNVEKMAPAAARYFRDNIMSFGDDSMSVALAIAGYNRAPESVKRDLRNVLNAQNNEDKERNFWTLVANEGKLDRFFQNENKNYVPRFFAAAILGETPWAFGIEMRALSTYTQITGESSGAPNLP